LDLAQTSLAAVVASVFVVLGIAFWAFILWGVWATGRAVSRGVVGIGSILGRSVGPAVVSLKAHPAARQIRAVLRACGLFVSEWIAATLMSALLGTLALFGFLVLMVYGVSGAGWLLASVGADSLGDHVASWVKPDERSRHLLRACVDGLVIISPVFGLGLAIREKLREIGRCRNNLNANCEPASPEERLSRANRAIELFPNDSYWRMMRARLCIQLGDCEQAIRDLRRTLVLAAAEDDQEVRDEARQALKDLGANP
jgi:hypothetical protein